MGEGELFNAHIGLRCKHSYHETKHWIQSTFSGQDKQSWICASVFTRFEIVSSITIRSSNVSVSVVCNPS